MLVERRGKYCWRPRTVVLPRSSRESSQRRIPCVRPDAESHLTAELVEEPTLPLPAPNPPTHPHQEDGPPGVPFSPVRPARDCANAVVLSLPPQHDDPPMRGGTICYQIRQKGDILSDKGRAFKMVDQSKDIA